MASTAERQARVLIVVLIVLYAVTFTVFTIERYHRYNATGWDLGIFTQLTWNAAHGRFLQNTTAEYNNMLALHAPYITIVLAPLFWLWSDPRMLLIAQSLILAAGAWPVARLAMRRLRSPWAGVVFAALWLLYPALGWMNRWDFHEIAPAAAFLAFAFEAADRRDWWPVQIWLVLALLCKEEVGLNVAFFGIYMALHYRQPGWRCAPWFGIGFLWFMLHTLWIFPELRGGGHDLPLHANRYEWLLDGDLAYLTGPDLGHKIAYLLKLLGPLAFLPLLGPAPLIVALPTFGLNLLSSYGPQSDIYMHYNAPIIPSLMVAAIFGVEQLRGLIVRLPTDRWGIPRRWDTTRLGLRPLLIVPLLVTFGLWIAFNPLWGSSGKTHIFAWEKEAHIDALNEVRQIIPEDACVVTENNIHPQYSVRREVYVVGARGTGPVGDGDGCQYMIIDLGDNRHDDFTVGEEVACFQLWSGKRAPIYYRDTVVVLEQMPAAADPDALRETEAYCNRYAGGTE